MPIFKRHPNDSLALSALAGAQLANNNKTSAEATLLKLIKQEKLDINNRLLLAQLMSEQPAKASEVLALLDEVIQLTPDRPEPLTFKVSYLIKLQRYATALDLASKIDNQFPSQILGKVLKADVYVAEKKFDKALESYQEAYKIQPNDKILFAIFDIMKAQGKLADAMALLNNALAKNTKNGGMHFKLANEYEQQKNSKQAEVHYKAILAIQPDNVLALNNLAWLYAQNNNPQAIDLAKQAYAKAPESPAITDTYGYILIKQGDAKLGLTLLEKAAAVATTAYDIQLHLAEAYVANDDKTKAMALLETLTTSEHEFAEKKAAADLLSQLKAD